MGAKTPKQSTSAIYRSSFMTVRLVWKRVAGIEPAWPAWKAGALPLSYTRAQYREKLAYAMQKDKHIFSSQRIFLSSCHIFHLLLTILADLCSMYGVICGRRSMVGRVLPKHETRVRFPSPVLKRAAHRLLFFYHNCGRLKPIAHMPMIRFATACIITTGNSLFVLNTIR